MSPTDPPFVTAPSESTPPDSSCAAQSAIEPLAEGSGKLRKEVAAVAPDSIQDLIRKIELNGQRSDRGVIAAAMLIRKLRWRVQSGEVGKANWYVWAQKHIKLSKSRLRELISIADAADPHRELQRLRNLALERKDRYRMRHATERELEPERLALITFAKKASIVEVRDILKKAGERTNVVIVPSIEGLEMPAVIH